MPKKAKAQIEESLKKKLWKADERLSTLKVSTISGRPRNASNFAEALQALIDRKCL